MLAAEGMRFSPWCSICINHWPQACCSPGSAGEPEISLGDALGSNVVNVALILGLTLMVAAIPATRKRIRREFTGALIVPVVVGILALDGKISRLDGAILLMLFLGWLTLIFLDSSTACTACCCWRRMSRMW